MTRDTTLDAIAADVQAWLSTRTWLRLLEVQEPVDVTFALNSEESPVLLPGSSSARDVDLFNRRCQLVAIVHAKAQPLTPNSLPLGDLSEQRRIAQQNAAQNRPDAPEHTQMLANILSERDAISPPSANLPLDTKRNISSC